MIEVRTNADTSSTTLTFLPAYNGDNLFAAGAISWNRSREHFTGVRTDSITANLDLRGRISEDYSYELSATASRYSSDDDNLDERNFNSFFQFLYRPGHRFRNIFDISFGLQGSYEWRQDNVYDERSDEFRLMFVILNASTLTL